MGLSQVQEQHLGPGVQQRGRAIKPASPVSEALRLDALEPGKCQALCCESWIPLVIHPGLLCGNTLTLPSQQPWASASSPVPREEQGPV